MTMDRKLDEFYTFMQGRRVAVLGVGISNRPLIRYIHALGADITAFDALPENDPVLSRTRADFERDGIHIHWSVGENYLNELPSGDFELIFRTPKMRPDVPELRAAVARGAVLTSEMEVFMELCPAKIFAVTGSDGKTTTTTLIAKILAEAGYRVHIGGNIGTPLLDRISDIRAEDMVVLELSSFQLITMARSADVAVVTNVTPNHLDVHRDYDEYISSKMNIFRNQSFMGRLVLNAENEITRSMAEKSRGTVVFFAKNPEKEITPRPLAAIERATILAGSISYVDGQTATSVVRLDEILIPGMHNVENYLAATAAVIPYVRPEHIASVAKNFGGVEHRIELVRMLDGVRYYNSSIDTSPNRTINTMRALESRGEKGVLIAGGADKKCDYTGLGDAILRVCDRIVLCGANAPLIEESLQKESEGRSYQVITVDSYPEALERARGMAHEGEIVILSPVGTSYDRFRHFEERGNLFKKLVSNLV